MLVVWSLLSLFYIFGQCQELLTPSYQDDDYQLIQCVIRILNKYFTQEKQLTNINLSPDNEELVKTIHLTLQFSLISREATHRMFVPNLGYLVSVRDVIDFKIYFPHLIREPAWNPYARFLIIIRTLKENELKIVFDQLLAQHVYNVLVLNGTKDAHLYTYNPFDKYACGKYYKDVIGYGLCSKNTKDLYPKKLGTGLKNCTFKAALAHRPPFTIDAIEKANYNLLGVEEYILKTLSEEENFTVNFVKMYDGEVFTTIAPNMTAIGPMSMLQTNEVDIIFGGIMMVESRAAAFTYLSGYHDYSSELGFVVKKSSLIPVWRYAYLEFEPDVWAVIVASLIIYSIVVVILLRSKDTGEVVLRLLDNFLLHGRQIRTRCSVKSVLIIWLWFTYLINTIYQSALVSFTTEPSMDFQISDEEDIITYNLEPCFGDALKTYLSSETSKLMKDASFNTKGCRTTEEAMKTVSTSSKMYTLVPNHFYLYNQRKYNDKWGESLVYYFEKPYAKFLFGFFFQKGFPIPKSLQLNTLRIRESGLVDQFLDAHYYRQRLRQNITHKTFETRFLFPWWICISGLVIATIVFILELIMKHT